MSSRPMTSLLQTISIRINLSRKESRENALIKQLYSCRKAASMSILNYLGTPSRFAFPWHSFTLAHKASSTSYFHLSKEQKRLTAQHHLPCLGASALSRDFVSVYAETLFLLDAGTGSLDSSIKLKTKAKRGLPETKEVELWSAGG